MKIYIFWGDLRRKFKFEEIWGGVTTPPWFFFSSFSFFQICSHCPRLPSSSIIRIYMFTIGKAETQRLWNETQRLWISDLDFLPGKYKWRSLLLKNNSIAVDILWILRTLEKTYSVLNLQIVILFRIRISFLKFSRLTFKFNEKNTPTF